MAENVGTEQARKLLAELHSHLADISLKLDAADQRNQRSRARGNPRKDPIASVLRREFHETHRLIDGIHRRFPQTAQQVRSPADQRCERSQQAG